MCKLSFSKGKYLLYKVTYSIKTFDNLNMIITIRSIAIKNILDDFIFTIDTYFFTEYKHETDKTLNCF
jgi:hypothetical protein